MEYPDEMNHPWHPKHRLRLLQIASIVANPGESISDLICQSCGELIEEETEKKMCYGCSTCGDFMVHLHCAVNPPPPLVVDQSKIHEHTLTLLPRVVSFTCNACGTIGRASPYVCLTCGFMIHSKCINLPRVIRTNRYLHRFAHTFLLASVKMLNCGVCDEGIDRKYGAYSSQEYPELVVHSRCAVRTDVWDGIDLEGMPEEEILIEPFNRTSDDTIKHFCHEHELRYISNDYDNDEHCYACNLHVNPEPVYKCVEVSCGFILHATCAYLPLKTRCPIHQHTLTLLYGDTNIFRCGSCLHVSNGFRYSCPECDFDSDTKCVSINEPFREGGHGHPLYLNLNFKYRSCCACDQAQATPLSCRECDFALCFACATLPNTVPYEDDAHPLSINPGGNNNGKSSEDLHQIYWCECCETQMNPLKNFYECSRCKIYMHIKCTIGGDLRNMRAGLGFNIDRYKCQVVLSDQVTRPFCSECQRRCEGPSILKCFPEDVYHIVTYFCSFSCLTMSLR